MRQVKVIVERHPDCFVAYPLGLKGVVVGQGDSFEAALADVTSAIRFHIETDGLDTLEVNPQSWKLFSLKHKLKFDGQISYRRPQSQSHKDMRNSGLPAYSGRTTHLYAEN